MAPAAPGAEEVFLEPEPLPIEPQTEQPKAKKKNG